MAGSARDDQTNLDVGIDPDRRDLHVIEHADGWRVRAELKTLDAAGAAVPRENAEWIFPRLG